MKQQESDSTPGDTMVRILIAFCVLSVARFINLDFAHADDAPERPNLIVILADDLGYGDLACCGAPDLVTPHLDRFFQRGMRFDNFYANSPVCSPTRASLLTGRYPELVGVPGVIRTHADDNWGYLSADAVLLPECLASAGYDTAIVGKWHLGLESPNMPNERGFDHFYGWLGDMMDDYYRHRRHNINYMRRDQEEIDPAGHATDLFTEWACDYLREQKAGKPFFLYLAYNAPHTPIQPPGDWLNKVLEREPDIGPDRAKLVALIEHMDDGIGKVLAVLEEQGLDENTIVVFTSDNGGQLSVGANNGPLRDGKQSMYDGGLKVPTAVVWPGKIEAGSRTERIGLSMDVFPTLLAAAGVKIEHEIDGRSLLPVLMGKDAPDDRRDFFFHRREGNIRYGGRTIEAIRRGDWKLLQNSPFAPQELYNLRTDPRESTNLVEREPGKYRELAAALRRHRQRGGAVPWQRPDVKDP